MIDKHAKEALDALGIDGLCDLIEDGESYRGIAKAMGFTKASLRNWLAADPVRSARALESRRISADDCDEAAYAAIEAIGDDATLATVTRQRELASHLRWRARCRDPRRYAEKLDASIKHSGSVVVNISEREGKL